MDAGTVFRLDNEVLAFRFTATVSDRGSAAPRERLTSPHLLGLWLDAAGLHVPKASDDDLEEAAELREAIYRVGAALASDGTPPPADVDTVNRSAAAGQASLQLDAGSAVWRLREAPHRDALGVLATDAIRVFGDPGRAQVRLCEGPGCAGLFLDNSRGRNRRWCSMNTCGNKVKKARIARH